MTAKRSKEGIPDSAGARAPGGALKALLVSGEVRAARAQARAMLGGSATDDERASAEDVLARTGLDRPALLAALGVLAVQLVWITVLYLA